VTEQAGLRFGSRLRQLRDQAGLTQDELAQAARVSQRAVSDLERGINASARKDTAVLLAGALAMALSRDLDDRHKQAWILGELGIAERLTGDHRSATVMHRRRQPHGIRHCGRPASG
jgi:transcriptional regulator with XRE-family HTH domain